MHICKLWLFVFILMVPNDRYCNKYVNFKFLHVTCTLCTKLPRKHIEWKNNHVTRWLLTARHVLQWSELRIVSICGNYLWWLKQPAILQPTNIRHSYNNQRPAHNRVSVFGNNNNTFVVFVLRLSHKYKNSEGNIWRSVT